MSGGPQFPIALVNAVRLPDLRRPQMPSLTSGYSRRVGIYGRDAFFDHGEFELGMFTGVAGEQVAGVRTVLSSESRPWRQTSSGSLLNGRPNERATRAPDYPRDAPPTIEVPLWA
jgi:hypothetical protein